MKACNREIEWARPGTHLLGRWNDRGRPLLTPETIKDEAREAARMYDEATRGRPGTPPIEPNLTTR